MKPNRSRSTALRFLPLALLLVLGGLGLYLSLAAPVPEGKPAAYPAWWYEREVIARTDPAKANPAHPADYPPAADFAALNQGQIKQFATAAFDELQAHLPGGAGPAITALVQSWYVSEGDAFKLDAKGRRIPLVTDKSSDFAPVTHGQLKELARHFFDRLQAELYYPTEQPYPWAAPGAQPAADYAMANLGHIKSLFQFDLTTDSDGDGIPDWWEKAHGLNSKDPSDALALSAGGTIDNRTAYRNNLDPASATASAASAAVLSSVTLTFLSKSVGLSAATLLDPGSSPVVGNGDFQLDVGSTTTHIGIGYHNPPDPTNGTQMDQFRGYRRWYCKSQDSSGWRAVGGETTSPTKHDSRVDRMQYEVQQRIIDYVFPTGNAHAGKLNQYCELDAHWERYLTPSQPTNILEGNDPETEGYSDKSKQSDHGIKQTVQVDRGNYALIFDYRGRAGVKNDFSVKIRNSSTATTLLAPSEFQPATPPAPANPGEISTTSWKRAVVSFSVTGGSPTGNNIDLEFDLEASTDADSYGVFIDNVILLPAAIKEVTFEGNGSSPTNYYELTSDTGTFSGTSFTPTTIYSAPHWKDSDGDGQAKSSTSGDRTYPVAFKRNTKIKVGAKFKVLNLPSGAAVKIKATGTNGLEIPESTVTPATDGTITLSPQTTSNELVDSIKSYKADGTNNFEIDWEINIDNVGWATLGTTTHTVYVTLEKPETSLRQETLFEIGCRRADGISVAANVTGAIWGEFGLADHGMERVDGVKLFYYNKWDTTYTSTEKLLNYGDGQCGAWVRFFLDLRKVHGLTDGIHKKVNPKAGEGDGFLINDWTFPATGHGEAPPSQWKWIAIWNNPLYLGHAYNTQHIEITDGVNGIPGQGKGNNDPNSWFSNHQLVKIGDDWYDPSYGIKFDDFDAWETASVAGYLKDAKHFVDEPVVGFDLNGDGDALDNHIETDVTLIRKNPAMNQSEEKNY